MYHHVKKPMYTVRVDVPDPAFGDMLLEQFGGANGELDVDLRSNIAAEARAKIVYERLINFTDDAGTKDALQSLMAREITHMKAFTAALESLGKPRFSIVERAANSPRLKQAFADHLEETREQTERLKEVFVLIGAEAKAKPCKGMAGLLEEGDETIEDGEEKAAVAADLALIAAAQKVEHYETSAYGTARSLAGQAGLPAASMLLGTSLAEEEIADNLLTQIARELMSESGDTAIRGGGEGKRQGKAAKSKAH